MGFHPIRYRNLSAVISAAGTVSAFALSGTCGSVTHQGKALGKIHGLGPQMFYLFGHADPDGTQLLCDNPVLSFPTIPPCHLMGAEEKKKVLRRVNFRRHIFLPVPVVQKFSPLLNAAAT